MVHVKIKSGASFDYFGNFALPAPTGSWSVRAIVATRGGAQVQALTTVLTPIVPALPTGENYSLSISAAAAQTAQWPLTRLLADLEFTDSAGAVIKSSTFGIDVERGIA